MKKLIILSFILLPFVPKLNAQTKHKSAEAKTADTAKPIAYYGPKGCPNAMTSEEFAAVYKKLSAEDDEDNLTVMANKEAGLHCYNIEQTGKIMKLFKKNDIYKFDFFKAAYTHIYDQNYYPKLKEIFQDASYSDKMRIYVNSLE